MVTLMAFLDAHAGKCLRLFIAADLMMIDARRLLLIYRSAKCLTMKGFISSYPVSIHYKPFHATVSSIPLKVPPSAEATIHDYRFMTVAVDGPTAYS